MSIRFAELLRVREVTGAHRGQLAIFSLPQGRIRCQFDLPATYESHLTFINEGQTLIGVNVLAKGSGIVRIDMKTCALTAFPLALPVRMLSADARYAIIGAFGNGAGNVSTVYDLQERKKIFSLNLGRGGEFSEDGKFFTAYVGSKKDDVVVYETASGNVASKFSGDRVSLSSRFDQACVIQGDQARLVDLKTRQWSDTFAADDCVFAGDGKTLVTTSNHDTSFWSVRN